MKYRLIEANLFYVMIYRFEILNAKEKEFLKKLEPFVEYSYVAGVNAANKWTVHKRVRNGTPYQELRLYQYSQLRQGLICTDFYEAKLLILYINDFNSGKGIEKDYPWIDKYVKEHRRKDLLDLVALPVSEYIHLYAHDFNQLSLVNFEEVFRIAGITCPCCKI